MSEILYNPVVEAIMSRRSIRNFKPKLIDKEQLDTILECGLWAPSGRNSQSTILAPSQNIGYFQQISDDIKAIMGIDSPDFKFNHGGNTVIFAFDKTGDRWFGVNAALAVQNMSLAAESLGLGSVIIGIIREYMFTEKGREWQKTLGVPEGYDFVCGLAVGYASETGHKTPRLEGRVIYS